MTLPPGWRLSKVEAEGRVQLGRQRHPDWHAGPNMHPYLRVANVFEDRIDTTDLKEMDFTEVFEQYQLYPGDVLLNEGQSPELLGRPAIYRGVPERAAFTNSLIRFQAGEAVTPEWALLVFRHYMHAGRFARESRITTNIAHLSATRFKRIEFPVPPLAEQRRIVEIVEEHLAHLDAADASLATAGRRAKALVKGVLGELIPDDGSYPTSWERRVTSTAGVLQLGRQRHPDWHNGPNMRPYLRVANVFEDRIDTRDVMEMHWPDDTFERFRLVPGDVLLNEGQTPDLLGRPAIYRGEPTECAFTNSLIRFRAFDDVLPEFALLVFRRHMHAGRFKRESRITTNIAHLSAARLKGIEFPVPPLEEQRRIVALADEQLGRVKALDTALGRQRRRSTALRRAVLQAAFEGRLTGASSDAEVVEEVAGE